MKVLFMTNVPSPYRVCFFSELGKLCDLSVLYERETAKGRNKEWKADQLATYKSYFLNGVKLGEDNSFSLKTIDYLKKGKYDVIVVGIYSTFTAMISILYMYLHNVQFVLSTDGGFVEKESKMKYLAKRYFISKASYWLSTGMVSTEYFVHYGAEKSRIFVYPFTSLADADLQKASEDRKRGKEFYKQKLNVSEKKMILSVGRFSYENGYGKGYDTLLKIAGNLPADYGIYIVGDEPTQEFLNWQKKDNLWNVHFVGFKKKSELEDFYGAADLFILMTRKDAWGLVINEALAYGLPVITTNKCIAGIELIHDNGYIVDVGDTNAVEHAITRIFSDEDFYNESCKNSMDIIQNYTFEKMAQRHFDIFKLIVGNKDGHGKDCKKK